MNLFRRKIIAIMVSLTLIMSNFAFVFGAETIDLEASTSNQTEYVELPTYAYGKDFNLENIDPQQLKQVLQDDEQDTMDTKTVNTPPVAGLVYMIANPESLLDGKVTTETIIYWLWNDGQTAHTYDPDGDAITAYYTGGVNNYILGNVNIGGVPVGFATKFTVAAQYELFFQVEDAQGALSNTVYVPIDVEPADGNKRPTCNITTSDTTILPFGQVAFDWANSFDPDGDNLSGVQVRVYDSTGNFENVTSSSSYYVGMNASGIQLKFPNAGAYQVRISLSDSKNAWSNWWITNITVKEVQFRDVKLTSNDPNNTNTAAFVWGDYALSVAMAKEPYSPEYIYSQMKIDSIPDNFQGKAVLSTQWAVSGYIETSDGEPLANQLVRIMIPMPEGFKFQKDIYTNSAGYFIYQCQSIQDWYSGWFGSYEPGPMGLFGIQTPWCRYGNNYTTEWMDATQLYVMCGSVKDYKTFEVVATAGSCLEKMLSNLWIYRSSGSYWYAF